eukprot:c55061_g1_i1.p1 GENE.c55061_g1_i1~~c55061_g1_i1.p1  ORF type:complete len:349 (+),score=49.53 c55061_g1_i1:43-1089(+)
MADVAPAVQLLDVDDDVKQHYNGLVTQAEWQYVRQYNAAILVVLLSKLVLDDPVGSGPSSAAETEILSNRLFALIDNYFDESESSFRGSHCHDVSSKLSSPKAKWPPGTQQFIVAAPYDKVGQQNIVHFACCVQTLKNPLFFDPTFSVDATPIVFGMDESAGLGHVVRTIQQTDVALLMSKGDCTRVHYVTPLGLQSLPAAEPFREISPQQMRRMVSAHLLAPERPSYWVSTCRREGDTRVPVLRIELRKTSKAWELNTMRAVPAPTEVNPNATKSERIKVLPGQLGEFIPDDYAGACVALMADKQHGKTVARVLDAINVATETSRQQLARMFTELGQALKASLGDLK